MPRRENHGFDRVRDELISKGYDVTDPLVLMIVLRRLGPAWFERVVLTNSSDTARPTDLTELANQTLAIERTKVAATGVDLKGLPVAVASTDVHWPAKTMLEGVLREVGATVHDGGLEIDSETLVTEALAAGCEAIVVTTHNGWALDFGERLSQALRRQGKGDVPLIMGGRLNQDCGCRCERSDAPRCDGGVKRVRHHNHQ